MFSYNYKLTRFFLNVKMFSAVSNQHDITMEVPPTKFRHDHKGSRLLTTDRINLNKDTILAQQHYLELDPLTVIITIH